MSGVVLRCPHCGTTRAAPGECEACHEAAVRYYCTNHDPGRWLDSPRCSACGASFGDPPRAPAPRPAARPPAARPPAARPPAAPPPAARPSPGAGRPPIAAPPRARVPTPSPWPGETRGPAAWPPRDSRGRPTIDVDAWERSEPTPPPIEVDLAPAGRALRGCLMRLIVLAVLALLALFGVITLLGGSLLRLFVGY